MKSISFSTLRNLQCPLRYVVYLTWSKHYNQQHTARKGNFIHRIYSSHIRQHKRFFDREEIPIELQEHCHDQFLAYIHDLIIQGYEAITERVYEIPVRGYEILDVEYIYLKPDIVMLRDDRAKIIEIKTGKSHHCKYQLQLYGWAITQSFEQVEIIEGIGYSTATNSSSLEICTKRDEFVRLVDYQLKLISECMKNYNITTLTELAVLGKHIHQFIPITDCHTCYIRKECPIVTEGPNFVIPWDDKLLSVESTETLVSSILCLVDSIVDLS